MKLRFVPMKNPLSNQQCWVYGVLISAVLLTAGPAVVAVHSLERAMENRTGQALAATAVTVAGKMDIQFVERAGDLRLLAQADALRTGNQARITQHLTNLLAAYPIYFWAGWIDRQDQLIVATSPLPPGQHVDFQAELALIHQGAPVIIRAPQPSADNAHEAAGITFLGRVEDAQGQFIGTLVTRMGLSTFASTYQRDLDLFATQWSTNGTIEVQLFDPRGRALVDSLLQKQQTLRLQDLDAPSTAAVQRGTEGYVREQHVRRHIDVLTGYAKTKGLAQGAGRDWTVLLKVERDAVMAPIRIIIQNVAGTILLILVPVLGGVWYGLRYRQRATSQRRQDRHRAEQAEQALQLEQRFRLMIDAVSDYAIVMLSPDGTVASWNNGARRIKQYADDEIIGRHYSVFYLPEDIAQGTPDRLLQQVSAQGRVEDEGWRRRKDGSRFWANVSITALHNRTGDLQGFLKVTCDLTQHHQAEKALRESEASNISVLNSLSSHIVVLNSQGVIIAMNTPWLRFAEENGAPHLVESFVGMNYLNVCAQAPKYTFGVEAAAAQAGILAVLAGTQDELSLEYPCHSPNQQRWFRMHVTPLGDSQTGVVVAHENITERKRAEERDQASRQLLEAVGRIQSFYIDQLEPSVYFDLVLQEVLKASQSEYGFIGEVLRDEAQQPYLQTTALSNIAWNDETRQLFREQAPNLIFRNLQSLFGSVLTTGAPVIANDPAHDPRSGGLPSGHPPMEAFLGLPLYQGATFVGMIGLANRPNGYDETLVEYLSPLLAACGSIVGSYKDHRRRLQAEEAAQRLAAIVEFSDDAIIGKTLDGLVTSWNMGAERLFGYTAADVIGRSIMILLPPDRQEEEASIIARVSQGERVESWETVCQRNDGRLVDVALTISPIQDEHGTIIGIAKIARDISARKEAAADRESFQDQIRQMQKSEALGQLAAGIAHDFNNILAAILGNTELSSARLAADHPVQTYLAQVLTATDRATHLVQQILAFTHHLPVARTVQSLAPALAEALALLRTTLPAHVVLRSTLDAATPAAQIDSTQLHQIVLNLCTNAWHALGAGRGQITVSLGPSTLTDPLHAGPTTLPPGRYVHLSVQDTGCGMDAETMTRIFDPFFTTKPVGQGTGLGLSVVQGLVQGHAGALVVESVLGQGTTVHVYFPAADEPIALAVQPAEAPPVAPRGQTRRVLYVEDEPALVELAQTQLLALGYEVSAYTEPAAALAALRADPAGVDVLITDYNMPGLSGLEVVRGARGIRADLPVVLTSGYLSPAVQAELLAAGVATLLLKPVTASRLVTTLAQLFAAPPQA